MSARYSTWLIAVSLAAVMFVVPACSSSDSDDNNNDKGNATSNTTVNIKGVYTGKRENTNGSANVTLNFKQSGNMLSGSYHDGSLGNGVISGNIDGDDLEFTTVMNAGGTIVEWVGEATSDGAKMSGTWSMLTGGTASGNWSAAR